MDKKIVRRYTGCAPHNFSPGKDDTLVPRIFVCSKCKIEITEYEHHWYARGYAHGRQENPNIEGR